MTVNKCKIAIHIFRWKGDWFMYVLSTSLTDKRNRIVQI